LTEQEEVHCLLSDIDNLKWEYERLDKHHKETLNYLDEARKKLSDCDLALRNTQDQKRQCENQLNIKQGMLDELNREL